MTTKTSIQPIEVGISTQRKLSIAVGLLSFGAFVVQGLGQTWGFQALGEQITQTALLFAGGVNLFFLGSTAQKITEEKKNGES